jgi:predicted GTPase
MGIVVYAGVDYAEILTAAQEEADVIIWDGGNNDLPFVRPDVHVTVADPLRPGHELTYHPGETNLRLADIVVINKVAEADPEGIRTVAANVRTLNPGATVVHASSPVTLAAGPSLAGQRALVVEDGPTITHGGMPYGAGTVAARAGGAAELVDPRPWAVGSIAATYATYPDIGPVLPAMGYGAQQVEELAATLRAADCDVVVSGTPFDLSRIVDIGHPIRRATYELAEQGAPDLAAALADHLDAWTRRR